MMFIFRLMVYSPAALPVSPKGTALCPFAEGFANSQRVFFRLTGLPDLHFHVMLTVIVEQGEQIARDRLTVEG